MIEINLMNWETEYLTRIQLIERWVLHRFRKKWKKNTFLKKKKCITQRPKQKQRKKEKTWKNRNREMIEFVGETKTSTLSLETGVPIWVTVFWGVSIFSTINLASNFTCIYLSLLRVEEEGEDEMRWDEIQRRREKREEEDFFFSWGG